MESKFVIFILIFLLSLLGVQTRLRGPKHGKVVVCHLSALELKYEPSFKIDDIELSLCTHLLFDNALLTGDNYTIRFENDRSDKFVTRESVENIKSQYPHIKITASVAVFMEESGPGKSVIPSSQRARDKLIRNAVAFIREYDFDGIDFFFFSFPEKGDEADDLLVLMQEIKEEFESLGYILTATLPVFDKLATSTAQLVKLMRYIDLLHISNSNYFRIDHYNNRIVIPLKSKTESDKNSVEFAIKHLLANKADPDKLVLLCVLKGFTHVLSNRDIESIPYEDFIATNSFRDVFRYSDICWELTAGERSWNYSWFEGFSVPYVREDIHTVLYENPRSIANKVKLSMDYGLKGFAIYGLHSDDFKGRCKLTNDTYLQFIDNYKKFNEDPNLLRKVKDLNLPNVDEDGNLNGASYGVLNNKLYFRPPQLKSGPYPILRTIDQAIALSLEEKKIVDALKMKPERPFCIFWPQCAAPIPLPKRKIKS